MIGTFTEAKRRAPNDTINYISSRMRAKMNKTVDYLDSLPQEQSEKLVNWAIGKGRKKRNESRVRQKDLMQQMSSRVAIKRQKKEDKERRKIEKKLEFKEV